MLPPISFLSVVATSFSLKSEFKVGAVSATYEAAAIMWHSFKESPFCYFLYSTHKKNLNQPNRRKKQTNKQEVVVVDLPEHTVCTESIFLVCLAGNLTMPQLQKVTHHQTIIYYFCIYVYR